MRLHRLHGHAKMGLWVVLGTTHVDADGRLRPLRRVCPRNVLAKLEERRLTRPLVEEVVARGNLDLRGAMRLRRAARGRPAAGRA